MKEKSKELHRDAAMVVIVTKDQLERIRELVEKKKFKDESEVVRKALDALLSAT